ncbi:MAG: metallophosphoesterase [Clostridia bacterium]|nr:metallophosphoesterase [Clostridia bacterium]
MKRNWCKMVTALVCMAMLCTLLPMSASATASDLLSVEPFVTGGQTSVRDTNLNSNDLAFQFEVHADGARMEEDYSYVSGSASTLNGQHKVLRVGAVVTNESVIGQGNMTLDSVIDAKVIDIQAQYLCSVEENAFTYAVRIVNIPDHKLDAGIYVRPYVVYEDKDGAEAVEYGETVSQSYNNATIPEEEQVNQQVKELLKTKHPLFYNEDGSFRVLIIADAHMNINGNATDVQEVKDRIKLLVDHEQPDLVIYTGDNTINSYSETSLRNNLNAIVSYVEEKKIPWCHVYGNHDEEYGMTKAKQQAVYESYEYCVSKAGPSDIFGVGNYVLGVYNRDGSLGSVIYCLDSGAYASGGYDYIKDNQVEWYEENSKLLQEYNGGQVVPALMAFHIPLYENRVAYENRNNKDLVYEWDGERNEDICSSSKDMNDMFETMLERGDVKAVVTGHDHINDYMFNYKGIKLCNSPNVSDLIYHDHRMQGARAFDMNLATIDNIPTHVTRLQSLTQPQDPTVYEVLADNVSLEFTKEQVEKATLQNWNGGAMTGTATLSLVDGKGVDGGDAIQILRSDASNFEFIMEMTNKGRLGNNKYLLVWADFTNVEFRKACFGLNEYDYYRTDDADFKSSFYYLPDGSTQWQTLSHGMDGCFGAGENGSQAMKGKKGYFAFPVEYFQYGSAKMNADTVVTGLYFYASMANSQFTNVPFYFDDIRLVADYKNLF